MKIFYMFTHQSFVTDIMIEVLFMTWCLNHCVYLSTTLHILKQQCTSNPYLFGYLTKVVDEANDGVLLERIINTVDVHIALVEEMVEDIDSVHGRGSLLLVAKHQVYPLIEVGTDIVTLQGLPVGTDKLPRVSLGPHWQHYIPQ